MTQVVEHWGVLRQLGPTSGGEEIYGEVVSQDVQVMWGGKVD